MTSPIHDLTTLRDALRRFSSQRQWTSFHTPKNLSMALIVEAAELVELFQWKTPEDSASPDEGQREAIRDEMADVLIYLVELADVLDIDLIEATRLKLVKNARKYPVSTALPDQQDGLE